MIVCEREMGEVDLPRWTLGSRDNFLGVSFLPLPLYIPGMRHHVDVTCVIKQRTPYPEPSFGPLKTVWSSFESLGSKVRESSVLHASLVVSAPYLACEDNYGAEREDFIQ